MKRLTVKHLTAILCLTLAVLLGSAGVSWYKDTVTDRKMLTVLLGSAKVSWSADYDMGLTAALRGDFVTALREWESLAEQGNSSAQYNLGQLYRNGQGVPQDNRTAVKWFKLAAAQGNADAQFNLGWMCHKGQGILQDDKTAVKWFKLAAEQRNAGAQKNLSVMYAFGKGVSQDYTYSHMWGNLAAANGNGLGGMLRDDWENKMTPADISVAQKLARECVRKKYKGC
jgi:TPR repeat protein